MKIVTQDKASELTVMLLQNDKKIKDEISETIDNKIAKVNTDVDNKFKQVDEKIDKITMPTVSTEDIEKLFK